MRLSTRADLASFEVVRAVKALAKKQNSRALAQLASKMNSAVKLGTSESDVFAKIKGLISDMIAKLQKEAESAAGEKEYCDKETSETTAKKEENEAEIKKLSVKIDQAKARSTKLKEEVAVLQKELAELAKSQAEMDEIRSEEKATFTANEAEMKKGIEGLQMALKVLNDFYAKESAHGSSEGAGAGIISLSEVAESASCTLLPRCSRPL
jgi:chromosome segregation ATPase